MPYCTKADLIERFGEDEMLSLAHDQDGAMDDAVIDRACDDASGEIDGYVSAAGYPVPLSPVPRIVTAYACDIARYRTGSGASAKALRRRRQIPAHGFPWRGSPGYFDRPRKQQRRQRAHEPRPPSVQRRRFLGDGHECQTDHQSSARTER